MNRYHFEITKSKRFKDNSTNCANPKILKIVGFYDSSEKEYGACYLKNSFGHKISNILCAKSKVAPLKKLTLPQLQLLTAVLLARLVKNAICSLGTEIQKLLIFLTAQSYWHG